MKIIIYLFLFVNIHFTVSGQIQYASGVINYSSQYYYPPDTSCYYAKRATGAPDVYPTHGDVCGAWASLQPDGQREFIELSYSTPQYVNQIIIYETYKPSAVDTIYLRNSSTNQWQKVWDTTAVYYGNAAFKHVINIALTNYLVNGVRLALNSPAIDSWNEIDAVGICNTEVSIYDNKVVKEIQYQLFPNPSTGNFIIKSSENSIAELLNSNGFVIRKITLQKGINNINLQLPAGIYFVKSEGTKVEKLIIQ